MGVARSGAQGDALVLRKLLEEFDKALVDEAVLAGLPHFFLLLVGAFVESIRHARLVLSEAIVGHIFVRLSQVEILEAGAVIHGLDRAAAGHLQAGASAL